MTVTVEGGEWLAARPGRTLPPGKSRYSFYKRLGGPQSRSGRAENLDSNGIRSQTVQHVVIRYTDWLPGSFYMFYKKLIKLIVYTPTQTDQSPSEKGTPVSLRITVDRKFSHNILIIFARFRKMFLVSPRQVIAFLLARGARKTCEWYFVYPTEYVS